MNAWRYAAVFLSMALCGADAAAAPPAAVTDRLSVTANMSTLSGDHGGGGAAVGLLHAFNENAIVGAELDYETIENSHWTFASFSGSVSRGISGHRTSLFGEVHAGNGAIGAHGFHYSIVAGGVSRTLGSRFSLQLEDRQIDVDTTHGNLPKLTANYFLTPMLQASASYAHSVSGNLGTNLGSLRIDGYRPAMNFFVGAASGRASPEVVNLKLGIAQPGRTLKEGFVGIAKPLAGAKWTVVADYLDLGGIKRATLTVNYIVELNGHGSGR